MSTPSLVWSYSKLRTFERCPHAIFLSDIQREPEPPRDPKSPAERGNRIHKDAEDFVQHKTDKLPHDLRKVKEVAEAMRQLWGEGLVTVEQMWGIDRDWQPVDPFKPPVWGRAKIDVFVHFDPTHAAVIDWKSGKKMGNEVAHIQQGQSYMLHAFTRFPELETVETRFVYTDEGKELIKTYQREQAGRYLERFTERALKMTDATQFPPKPNIHNCRWCPFGPNVGTGACVYGVNP